MPKSGNNISLVADVGGTNTRIALAQYGTVDVSSIERFSNRDFASLQAVIGGIAARPRAAKSQRPVWLSPVQSKTALDS